MRQQMRSSFNSIVVRLKAIPEPELTKPEWDSFNSIVVRLKASLLNPKPRRFWGFNSIVVRLKAGMRWFVASVESGFQFHSGSIKSL